MKARYLIPFAIFMAIMAIFVLGLYKMKEDPNFVRNIPSVLLDKPAPEIVLPDLFDQTKMVKSSELLGQVWLMNIWGTWCPECWREHSYLVHLAEHEGVKIFGIDWRDDAVEAQKMIQQKGNPFVAIGFDPESRTAMNWGVSGAPETFVIDKRGVVRWKHNGGITPQLWQEEMKPLLLKLEQEQ